MTQRKKDLEFLKTTELFQGMNVGGMEYGMCNLKKRQPGQQPLSGREIHRYCSNRRDYRLFVHPGWKRINLETDLPERLFWDLHGSYSSRDAQHTAVHVPHYRTVHKEK